MVRKCRYCRHLECEECRKEQKEGKNGYCCKCHELNAMIGSCEGGRNRQGMRGLLMRKKTEK